MEILNLDPGRKSGFESYPPVPGALEAVTPGEYLQIRRIQGWIPVSEAVARTIARLAFEVSR